MDFLERFGLYLVKSLGSLAEILTQATSPLPWPVVSIIIAIPLLFILTFVIWLLRGLIWPVRCKYPETTKRIGGDTACRTWVRGEWRYCRYHNQKYTNYRGHNINPHLAKWQIIVNNQVVERTDIQSLTKTTSIFFYKGFARSPKRVWQSIPDSIHTSLTNLKISWLRLRKRPLPVMNSHTLPMSMNSPITTTEEQLTYRGINKQAETADQVIKLLKWILPSSILIITAGALSPEDTALKLFLEYSGLLALGLIFSIIYYGLIKPQTDSKWIYKSIKTVIFMVSSVLTLAIGSYAFTEHIMPFLESFT